MRWESTGTSGVAYARDKSPHLVILDIRLPDGSGFDFCREMRRLGLRQPILILTVQGDEVDKVLGLEMGADDYLTKPYKLRELIARVRALLRRAYGELSTAEADLLFVSDLVIDRASARVSRGDKRINLTPTEFRLLVFLAQHPGQVFSRGQLMDQVWGHSADYYDDKTGQRARQTAEGEDRTGSEQSPSGAHRSRSRLPAGGLCMSVREAFARPHRPDVFEDQGCRQFRGGGSAHHARAGCHTGPAPQQLLFAVGELLPRGRSGAGGTRPVPDRLGLGCG